MSAHDHASDEGIGAHAEAVGEDVIMGTGLIEADTEHGGLLELVRPSDDPEKSDVVVGGRSFMMSCIKANTHIDNLAKDVKGADEVENKMAIAYKGKLLSMRNSQ